VKAMPSSITRDLGVRLSISLSTRAILSSRLFTSEASVPKARDEVERSEAEEPASRRRAALLIVCAKTRAVRITKITGRVREAHKKSDGWNESETSAKLRNRKAKLRFYACF